MALNNSNTLSRLLQANYAKAYKRRNFSDLVKKRGFRGLLNSMKKYHVVPNHVFETQSFFMKLLLIFFFLKRKILKEDFFF